jgi:hypothetical protein
MKNATPPSSSSSGTPDVAAGVLAGLAAALLIVVRTALKVDRRSGLKEVRGPR